MNDIITKLAGDTSFWVMLSTLLCFAIIGLKGRKAIAQGLNDRSEAIRLRLAEAEALRLEAEAVLAESHARADRAAREAEEIVNNAKQRAEQLRTQLEADFNAMIAREESRAKVRIARLETEAVDSVKALIVSQAMDQVKASVANDKIKPSIDAALDDVKTVLQK